MKKYLFVLGFFGWTSLIHAQERLVHGKVSTLENIAVANARVVVKSTGHEVLTDSAGLFSIECNPSDKLKIYANGFYNLSAKVKTSTKYLLVNMRLKPGIENREYAVGYGHISDMEKLNAISNLHTDDLDFSSYKDVPELIRGQFPGVRIEGTEIIIRNTTTMVNNEGALIVLDGRTIDYSTLVELVPTDIKSINIIKDGSAAMYGVKGANGVVVIETRRGGD